MGDPRIWPGPESMRPNRWERIIALSRCGLGLSEAEDVVNCEDMASAAESHARIAGIARGRARARASVRMVRFVAWLEKSGACDPGLAFARRHATPELAVMARAERCRFCSWIYRKVDEHSGRDIWLKRWLRTRNDRALARRLLASPEWAALPWQGEP